MEYTIQKLSRLAGVSARTLRYYDEIGLLKPARISSSGYRIYGRSEVDRLQSILLYRELEMPLEQIRNIVASESFDAQAALQEHRERLIAKREQIERLIANVERTIAAKEGGSEMSDMEKFEGFKRELVEENERKFGREVREKYGDEAVERSNEQVMRMTPEQHEAVTRLSEELTETLAEAFLEGDPAGAKAQRAAALHRRWLTYFWPEYSKEAHAGLAQMYVDDERFRAYYDAKQPGTAEFLRNAIYIYTGMDK